MSGCHCVAIVEEFVWKSARALLAGYSSSLPARNERLLVRSSTLHHAAAAPFPQCSSRFGACAAAFEKPLQTLLDTLKVSSVITVSALFAFGHSLHQLFPIPTPIDFLFLPLRCHQLPHVRALAAHPQGPAEGCVASVRMVYRVYVCGECCGCCCVGWSYAGLLPVCAHGMRNLSMPLDALAGAGGVVSVQEERICRRT